MVGVVLASGPEIRGDTGWRPVLLAAGSALFLGLSLVAIARGSETSVVMTMTDMRLTTVTLMLRAWLVTRQSVAVAARTDPPWRRSASSMSGRTWPSERRAPGAAGARGGLRIALPGATILLARWLDGERLRPSSKGRGSVLVGVAAISAG